MNKEELLLKIDDTIFENEDGDISGENLNEILKDTVGVLSQTVTDKESGLMSPEDKIKLDKVTGENRPYEDGSQKGLGYIILEMNLVNDVNTLTQSMVDAPNTIYVVRYDFDLGGETISIPEGSVLRFEGGSFSNGVLSCNRCAIEAGMYEIFKEDCTIKNAITLKPEWFGAKGDGITDDTLHIHRCASMKSYSIEFQSTSYYITDTITLNYDTQITTNGCIFRSNVPHKFAIVINPTQNFGHNKSPLLSIVGGMTLVNLNYNHEVVELDLFIPASSGESTGTIEGINTSNVKYVDLPIPGAKIGDVIMIDRDMELPYFRFSGEIIADDTIRVYYNNYGVSTSYNFPDKTLKATLIKGSCSGINIGGICASSSSIRVVDYSGVSIAIGSGVDIESGLRFNAWQKMYYSELIFNTYAISGISVSIPARNNCNQFTLSSFSNRRNLYTTDPYRALCLNGINNIFPFLSIEGTYVKPAMLVAGVGNNCQNIYFEGKSPSSIESYSYSTSNTLTSRYGYLWNPAINTGDNFMNKLASHYVNGSAQKQGPTSTFNLLNNPTFKVGSSGWDNYSYSPFTSQVVEGPFYGTTALKITSEGTRISLHQNIRQSTEGVGFSNVRLTFGCWVRGNFATLSLSKNGVNYSNSGDYVTEETQNKWRYIETSLWVEEEEDVLCIIKSEGSTSGRELYIFNPVVTVGNNALSINQPYTFTVNSSGTVFGNPMPAGESVTEEFAIGGLKKGDPMPPIGCSCNESLYDLFDIRYFIDDGVLRVTLTNITSSPQYSGRLYFKITI